MKPLLLAIALLATPAAAQDALHWGGSSATLRPADAPAVAVVDLVNGPTGFGIPDPDGQLTLGGFSVHLRVIGRGNPAPDTYLIVPPEGYIAVPAEVTLEEGGRATVTIYRSEGAFLS